MKSEVRGEKVSQSFIANPKIVGFLSFLTLKTLVYIHSLILRKASFHVLYLHLEGTFPFLAIVVT